MRLYLSSYRIPNFQIIKDFFGGDLVGLKVLIITNAKDHREKINALQRIEDLKQYLSELGFIASTVDLRDYSTKPDILRKLLSNSDLLYAIGGNQFSLSLVFENEAIRDVFIDVLKGGKVYIGESAGAMIVGKNLDLDNDLDEKNQVPKVLANGLRLIDFTIVPHADNDYKDYGKRAHEVYRLAKNKKELILLNDNQAFVVDGDKTWIDTGSYQEMR